LGMEYRPFYSNYVVSSTPPVTSSPLGPKILGTITHYLTSVVKITGWGEARRW
jgi:hypothetical protein